MITNNVGLGSPNVPYLSPGIWASILWSISIFDSTFFGAYTNHLILEVWHDVDTTFETASTRPLRDGTISALTGDLGEVLHGIPRLHPYVINILFTRRHSDPLPLSTPKVNVK
jgi:hypothetical protein